MPEITSTQQTWPGAQSTSVGLLPDVHLTVVPPPVELDDAVVDAALVVVELDAPELALDPEPDDPDPEDTDAPLVLDAASVEVVEPAPAPSI